MLKSPSSQLVSVNQSSLTWFLHRFTFWNPEFELKILNFIFLSTLKALDPLSLFHVILLLLLHLADDQYLEVSRWNSKPLLSIQ